MLAFWSVIVVSLFMCSLVLPLMSSFIHLLGKHLWKLCYVPGVSDTLSALEGFSLSVVLCGARNSRQINKNISDNVKPSARNWSQGKSDTSGDQDKAMWRKGFERDVNDEKRLAEQRSGGKVSWADGIARILWWGKGQCWWSSIGGGVDNEE